MHKYKIMHLDIKPDNIMFSNHFKKLVFIDFGFSEIIREEVGLKSLTGFRGTPSFVSPEMFKLFSLDVKNGMIDLYYNDLVGLKASISAILQKRQNMNLYVNEYL